MAKKCPHCGTLDNPPEYEFCKFDGFELVEDTAATAPSLAGTSPSRPAASLQSSAVRAEARSNESVGPATTSHAKLLVMVGGKPIREIALAGDQAVIGRWDSEVGAFPEVDLTDDDPGCYVSRHHARIYLNNGRYFIEDLGSANKTVLNKSNRLNAHAPTELRNGDEIIVGKTFLKFGLDY